MIENVYVLPGLPAEMEAMFETIAEEMRGGAPIATWRRTYRTTESRIVDVLEEVTARHPGVLVGSYPSFAGGVARSRDRGQVRRSGRARRGDGVDRACAGASATG